jgi:hypothetical protein
MASPSNAPHQHAQLVRELAELPDGSRAMTDFETRAKARAERMTLRKGRLGDLEVDLNPVFGAQAISLVQQLTRASYSLAGLETPTYARATIPCRFVRWPRQ